MNHIKNPKQNQQLAVIPVVGCGGLYGLIQGLQCVLEAQRSVVAERTCLQVWGADTTPSLCSAAHNRGRDEG